MTNRYSIVGTQFTGIPESFIAQLAPGTPALLVREPTNQYDPNAVAVWVEGKRIGYIPKKQNAGIAKRIDEIGSSVPPPSPTVGIATDSAGPGSRSIPAKFVRSPNSGFPMVEVQE